MIDPVVVLTVDSLAAHHVGCFGYERETTPRLDSFARDELLYTHAVAQSSHTRESIPSLFFSAYPSTLPGVGPVPADRPTLSTELADANYETAFFHSNPYLSRAYGFDRGFDTFEDSLPLSRNRLFTFLNRVVNHFRTEPYVRAEKHNQQGLDWLETHDGKPRFLWLHYMDPHGPYQPPSEYQEHFLDQTLGKRQAKDLWRRMVDEPDSLTDEEVTTLVDLYDAEIRYTDEMIGRLLDDLDDRAMLDDALVVVAADHGELFGEHGRYGHPRRVYEELVHVPLILSLPSEATGTVDCPVENVDIGPTILEAIGQSTPEQFTGDPLPTAPVDDNGSERTALAECRGEGTEKGYRCVAVRSAENEYRVELDPDGQRQSGTLSAIVDGVADGPVDEAGSSDPPERIETRLRQHLDMDSAAAPEDPTVDSDSEIVERRLRDLGYK